MVLVFTLYLTLTLCSGWTLGCIPSDSHGGRLLDGRLKCYECNSLAKPLCSLSDWKFANQTVRRTMEKQCPRRLSAFCYLKLAQNGSGYTERGCFKSRFLHNVDASVGCINMGLQYRVCLCTDNKCNSAGLPSPTLSAFMMVFLTLITSNITSL